MPELKKPTETIALAKNKLYKTYQFYGMVGRGKNPDHVFRASIAMVFAWLRERFRQFDDIPKQLILPAEAREINEEMLKSFQISDGYTIETIYIKEEGLWSFRLTEPDMGSSERRPAPGRLFLTNFAFKKGETEVEFGCQLICSQPESIEEDAEVFRPRLVRDLLDKFGLYAGCDLKYLAFDRTKASGARIFKELLEDEQRQMPIVLIERQLMDGVKAGALEEGDLAAAAGRIANYRENNQLINLMGPMRISADLGAPFTDLRIAAKSLEQVKDYAEESDKLARKLAGFAYIFLDTKAEIEKTTIYFPGKAKSVERFEKIAERINAYPKRNEAFHFGQVLFYSEARLKKQSMDVKKLQESQDFIAENGALKDKIILLRRQVEEKKQQINDLAGDNQTQKMRYEELKFKHRQDVIKWADEKAKLEKLYQASQYELRDISQRLAELERKSRRPEDISQFIKWVEANYAEDIFLHARAKDGLKRCKNINMDTFCDDIEVLAGVYKSWRLGLIEEADYISGCRNKGETAFEIGPCGDQNIWRFKKDYKITYGLDVKNNPDQKILDYHLKSGVDARYLVRIYFFWDADAGKVIIGSMPDHLPVVSVN